MPSGVALISPSLTIGAVNGAGSTSSPNSTASFVASARSRAWIRTAEIPTSFSATSAARAAPPLPSRVTLPIARLGFVQPGQQGRDGADIGIGGDQLALAHHQHIGGAGGDRPVGRLVGQAPPRRASAAW